NRRITGSAKSPVSWLSSSIGFNFQGAVVLPRDVETRRDAHDRGRAVRFARVALTLVFRAVPRVGRPAALVVDRHARVVALFRRHHAPAPVFRHDRHPPTRQVCRRLLLRCLRRLRATTTSGLAWLLRGQGDPEEQDEDADRTMHGGPTLPQPRLMPFLWQCD